MMNFWSIILIVVAVVSFVLMLMAISAAQSAFREAQSTIFPLIREQETGRGRWASVISVIFALICIGSLGSWANDLMAPSSLQDVAQQESESTEQLTERQPSTVLQTAEVVPTETEIAEVAVLPTETSAVPPTGTPDEDEKIAQVSSVAPEPTNTPTPQPTATTATVDDTETASEATAGITSTPTPRATATLAATNTPRPRNTSTPTQTPTSASAPASDELASLLAATELTNQQVVSQTASIGPLRFSNELDYDSRISSRSFAADIEKVYAIFPYSGMQDGQLFTAVWYRDERELWRTDTEWEWGDEARSHLYVNISGAGTYRLTLFIDDSFMTEGEFSVR